MTRTASSVTLRQRKRGVCQRSRIVILASSERAGVSFDAPDGEPPDQAFAVDIGEWHGQWRIGAHARTLRTIFVSATPANLIEGQWLYAVVGRPVGRRWTVREQPLVGTERERDRASILQHLIPGPGDQDRFGKSDCHQAHERKCELLFLPFR